MEGYRYHTLTTNLMQSVNALVVGGATTAGRHKSPIKELDDQFGIPCLYVKIWGTEAMHQLASADYTRVLLQWHLEQLKKCER